MKLDKSPFVIISVIGQELLAAGYHASSLVVLESALKIGETIEKIRCHYLWNDKSTGESVLVSNYAAHEAFGS